VASAGPYASLHLAPDRKPRQYPTTPVFLQAGCPSCRPTNSVKALKAKTVNGSWPIELVAMVPQCLLHTLPSADNRRCYCNTGAHNFALHLLACPCSAEVISLAVDSMLLSSVLL